jgi:mono/diheme cytochrome c family protein
MPMKPAILLSLLALALPCNAADPLPTVSEGRGFVQRDGAALYQAICQGCHMADGRGAEGGGSYPALAGNPRLASAPYVMLAVLNGRKAMPGFGFMLDDAQVAAVVNQVRNRFGNGPQDPVAPADVRALRPPRP